MLKVFTIATEHRSTLLDWRLLHTLFVQASEIARGVNGKLPIGFDMVDQPLVSLDFEDVTAPFSEHSGHCEGRAAFRNSTLELGSILGCIY